ncbi:hypothetical protein BGZ73_007607, partial [Actinomortierella ambigua]
LAYEVAKHLDTADLASVVRVSKAFFHLFTPCLWRTMVIEHAPAVCPNQSPGRQQQQQQQSHSPQPTPPPPPPPVPQPPGMWALGPFQTALARYGHRHISTLWINMSSRWLVRSGLAQHCRRLEDLTLQLDQSGQSAEEMEDEEDNDDEEDVFRRDEEDSVGGERGGQDHDHHEQVQNRFRRRWEHKRHLVDKQRAVDALLRHNHKTLTYLSLMSLHLPVRAKSFQGMDRLRQLNLSFVRLEMRAFFLILEQAPLLEKLGCRFNTFYVAGKNGSGEGDEEVEEESDEEERKLLRRYQLPLGVMAPLTTTTTTATTTEETLRRRHRLQSLSFVIDGQVQDAKVLSHLLLMYPQLIELELTVLEVGAMDLVSRTLERTCPDLQMLSITASSIMRPRMEAAMRQLTVACRQKAALKSLEIGMHRTSWSPCWMQFEYLAPQLEQLQLFGVGQLRGENIQHNHDSDSDDSDGEYDPVPETEEEEDGEEDGAIGHQLADTSDVSHDSQPWVRTLLQACTRLRSLQIYARRGKAARFVLKSMTAINEWHCQGIEELTVVFPTFKNQDGEEEEEVMDEDDSVEEGGDDEERGRDDEDDEDGKRAGHHATYPHQQHQQTQQPTPPPSNTTRRREALELRFLRKVRTSLPRLRHLCLQEYDSRHPGLRLKRGSDEIQQSR